MSSRWEGGFCREKVDQEGFIDGDRVGVIREGGESRGLPRGDKLFGRPDVLG